MPKTHMITELSYARLIFIFSTNTCYCLLRALNAVLITCLWYSTKDSLIERNLSWIEQSTLYKDNFLPLFFKTILFVCFPKAKPNPVPNFWVSKWNRYLQGVAIQMKVTEKYFPMVLFTMLYKVVRTVYETSKLDNSYESCLTVIFCGTVYYVEHEFLNLWSYGWKRRDNSKGTSSVVLSCCAVYNAADKIQPCGFSNEDRPFRVLKQFFSFCLSSPIGNMPHWIRCRSFLKSPKNKQNMKKVLFLFSLTLKNVQMCYLWQLCVGKKHVI